MSHDTSRIRFDPRDHHDGVLLQQGRPLTDADWNEALAQRLHHAQAASLDTFGPAVVPATTPDGFAITPVAGGFTIGVGRMYVDGLLAENHGTGTAAWDARLEQLVGPTAVAYTAQPHWPAPPGLPPLPYAVVLDVWHREVDAWQDERLLEPALGGVDTTARLQTVWQVRAVPVAAGTVCATPWVPPAPSAARLSSAAVNVPGAPNPCLVPPGGGYQGGENQLYRIEVHDGGPLGTATFKWSRDNASVQARVVAIPDTSHLVVDSVGRDEVLRFSDGDWIEVLDDRLELQGQATADGAPGLLRQILIGGGVDDATRTITLAQPLPAGTFPVDAQGRPTGGWHCRIRRWDQRGAVRRADGTVLQNLGQAGSTGAITIPAAGVQVVLENGIAVDFGLAVAGGRFRSGDWWVVAARASDASVEILASAPPRGVHHHFSKLAIVSATGVQDCRTPWPPTGGCCTMVVAPGESIQAAIDALPPEGGCVCLKSGLHRLPATLDISRSNVQLHGEAPGTRVQGDGLASLLSVSAATSVEVAQIVFEALSCPASAYLVGLLGCSGVRLRDCTLRYAGNTASDCTAAAVVWANDTRFDNCRIEACGSGIDALHTFGGLAVAGCSFAAQTMPPGGATASLTVFGVHASSAQDVAVEGCRFVDCHTAVALEGRTARARVAGNTVERRPLPAAMAVDTPVADMLWAVSVRCDDATVTANRIEAPSVPHGGVLVQGERCTVQGNHLVGGDAVASLAGPIGVCVGGQENAETGQGARVEGNQLRGLVVAVLVRRSAQVAVHGNTVQNAAGANGLPWYGFGIAGDRSRALHVGDNQLQDVGVPLMLSGGSTNVLQGNTIERAAIALLALDESDLECSHQRVDSAAWQGLLDLSPEGTHRFIGNRLRFCGGLAQDLALGIGVFDGTFAGTLIVTDNEILDTGVVDAATGFGAATAVGVGAAVMRQVQVDGNTIAYPRSRPKLDRTKAHRALVLCGPLALAYATSVGVFTLATGAAQIRGNRFDGPGRPWLVELRRLDLGQPAPGLRLETAFERVIFQGNHCDHDDTIDAATTVSLRGGAALAVQGNQQRAGPLVHAMDLGMRPAAAVLGNMTTGDFLGVASTVPTPLTDFNVRL